MQLITSIGLLATLQATLAHPQQSQDRCPTVHVIAARGTGVQPGYDILLPLVDKIKSTYAGATSEALGYPACGGGSSCGGISYKISAEMGTVAVAKAVNEFHKKCPETQLVLMGCSQGSQIIDNALCGGDDPSPPNPASSGTTNAAVPICPSAAKMVKAAIFVGNPRFQPAFSYAVGTCKSGYGFDARPESFTCPNGDKIRSYCDKEDPYCCHGHDSKVHGEYVQKYGEKILEYVNSKLAG
ncbi:hypothetical protein EsDP_00001570 [Epichloe bromicola]|uniref:Acetylxylan esterase n=1 Tax=Epichloe bromicola TaxID=79588 RepID=A0ABQ0CI82_9HYPO